MRCWPGARWRKDPSLSTCLVSSLSCLACLSPRAVPVSPLLGCLLECWLLSAGGGSAGPPWQDALSAPPAALLGCSQLSGCPLNLHAPHQALAGTVGEGAQLAWCYPTYWMRLFLKWQFKISHMGRGQRQRTNPSLAGNHFWAVQRTSLFTSRTPFASPSLSSPSKCHRFPELLLLNRYSPSSREVKCLDKAG